MVPILALWLPILVSALFVFVLSSLIHMVFGYHANDYRKVPDENAFAEAIKKLKIPPGAYSFPRPNSIADMKSPEYQEKVKQHPGVMFTLWPAGQDGMTSMLFQWFLYSIIVSIFAAYVAGRALDATAHYLAIFRFVGVTAFVSYALGGWSESIWFKRAWTTTLKNTFDGLLYALVTAGTFGWLWPR